MFSYPQYGPQERFEPVIYELLASTPMQRLKKIHQLGVFHFLNPAWSTKRYEHSLGVAILLRQFGASLEEQVAGLLHDVSHLAFSHVADYLFEQWDEEFGEEFTHERVTTGEIAEILTRHDIDPTSVTDLSQFGLLERSKPDLCADRLDYTFRDSVCFGQITIDEARAYIQNITVHNGSFAFQTPEIAGAFTKLYISNDRDFYANAKYIASYFIMSDAMKRGMERGILTMHDLWQDDDHVLRLLLNAKDAKIEEYLSALLHGFDLEYGTDQPTYVHKKKVRYVDPYVLQHGRLERISHIDSSTKEEIALYLTQREAPVSFSIISRDTCQPLSTI